MRRRFMNNTLQKGGFLTITAVYDSEISFSLTSNIGKLFYRKKGRWNLYSGTITLVAGESVQFKGDIYIVPTMGGGQFDINGGCNISGYCTSILYGENYNQDSISTDAFYELFAECDIIDASNLILPATTLASNCYNSMFYGCTGLTQAPELPATTLAEYCYNSMFYGCTNLNYIKALFTTTPSGSYTNYWVYNVASTGTFVKSKDATWNVTGVNGVPSGWTVITDEEESGGGKIKNIGSIKPVSIGSTTYINWLYPVASYVSVFLDVGMSTMKVFTAPGGSKSEGITIGPGESFVSIVKIEPLEDETYIYEVVIE